MNRATEAIAVALGLGLLAAAAAFAADVKAGDAKTGDVKTGDAKTGDAGKAAPAKAPTAEQKRGAYLAQIMDCGGCHTPGALAGKPAMERAFAGSDIGFGIPDMGVFYPPNLTPDAATGLGTWSAEAIIAAVRTGVRPDGRVLAPAMPWRSYAALNDQDAKALAAYLKSLPPVSHAVPAMAGPSETPKAPYLAVVLPGK